MEGLNKPRQCIKKQRHHFADKGPYTQGYGLSSSHVEMWGLWAARRCWLQLPPSSCSTGPLGASRWSKSPESWLAKKHIIKQRHRFNDRGLYSQSYGFSSSHVQMWELDHKEGWVLKNWCFQTVLLKRIHESPLDSKEIKPVSPKRNQPWIFIGRTDAEADIPMLCPPDVKSWLTGKDPDAGRDWGQEKWVTEDEMVGWHDWLSGHDFEQTLGDSEGQGSLAYCSPWGRK